MYVVGGAHSLKHKGAPSIAGGVQGLAMRALATGIHWVMRCRQRRGGDAVAGKESLINKTAVWEWETGCCTSQHTGTLLCQLS